MPSYISHNFGELERSIKVCFFLSTLWLGIIILLALPLMGLSASGILPPIDVSKEYQRSLDEFMKNRSVSHHKTDKRFTPYWAAQVYGGESVAMSLAIKYGFTYLGEIMPGIYYFRHRRVAKRSLHQNVFHQKQLYFDPNVRWAEQQVAKVRVKRDVYHQPPPNDPSWPRMWYLNRGGPGGIDMNVRSVWARGYAGQGIVVTILDDGLETDHPDLKPNYDRHASFDVNSNDENPDPRYVERDFRNINRHGTRCAGEVAAAANNSICGLGIAFKARIGGVRMLDGDVTDAMESRSLGHNFQHIDVYSASWGPEDDGRTVDGPGKLARIAFRNGILKGRGGLGSIFVWASGNGGKYDDNCNCDGYTNSIYTLGVSSASEHGTIPWYAETCSSTLAVTYSSGGQGEKGVVTTDLNHTCTDSHSGTSASAPLAAGICALTLSANPRLTWRDLQYIVIHSARPDGLYTNDWRVNGVGRRVSHAFGYGLMDAAVMVDLALNWTTVPTQRICEVHASLPRSPLKMRHHTTEQLRLETDGCLVNEAGDPSRGVAYLEHVQAKVTLTSDCRGEVELWLTSPMGTKSKLLSKRPFDLDVAGFHAWPFMSVHFWGETANGTWTLTVHSGNAVVSLIGWSLSLYGVSTKPPHHPSHQQPVLPTRGPRERQIHPLASMLDEHDPGVPPPPPVPFSPKTSVSFSPEAYAVGLGGKPPPPPPPSFPFGSDFLDIWNDHIVDVVLEGEGAMVGGSGGYQGNGKWYDSLHHVYQMPPPKPNTKNNLDASQTYHSVHSGGYGLERLNSPRKSNSGGGGGWQRIELTRQSAVKSVKSSAGWWLKEEGNGSATITVLTLSSLFTIFYTFLCLFV
ncbi:Furin-like protease 1, isoforms 1/1-X/2 [Echinococcus granulosus]|uniref:Furin n=1 Tax=Echinococcus granulosus TaxID=6210 RepID=A0A068W928_ECHGR|nr:Furin-like protease 1, isoforms 1/1-X/2 [Echinococcus granulosus]CDS16543.1 furin [Echinococcus granulosus]